MRIFNKSEKVNFVDKNNVFVGFDTYQSCCERFGWEIVREIPTKNILGLQSVDDDLESYVFDTTYYKDIGDDNDSELGAVAFKLVSDGKQDLFLILYNSHNGYYSHGFDVKKNEHLLYSGSL